MSFATEHEKVMWQALDQQQSDLASRLLPLLRVCRFATAAADALDEVQTMARNSPEFERQIMAVLPMYNDPAPAEVASLVCDVLIFAERLASEMSQRAAIALQSPPV
ncbi:MAG: hypothetical protein Q8R06_09705 [Polaromonas sp.]|uniref:hypothetical protein n=1 Tax=Polaromonas sp. TaxID=1869339 RepID=UPI0027323B0F|nr:hypothetical protein [Polaromonas sp.]MDP3797410.1 hypothetical protein [Polaromonas sp.]